MDRQFSSWCSFLIPVPSVTDEYSDPLSVSSVDNPFNITTTSEKSCDKSIIKKDVKKTKSKNKDIPQLSSVKTNFEPPRKNSLRSSSDKKLCNVSFSKNPNKDPAHQNLKIYNSGDDSLHFICCTECLNHTELLDYLFRLKKLFGMKVYGDVFNWNCTHCGRYESCEDPNVLDQLR